jgi:hypothetical protein
MPYALKKFYYSVRVGADGVIHFLIAHHLPRYYPRCNWYRFFLTVFFLSENLIHLYILPLASNTLSMVFSY